MKLLRVYYTSEDLIKKSGERVELDIDNFPLKPGKYRLNKHPSIVFWIINYENGELTFKFKNNKYTLKDGCYTYFKLKKTDTHEYTVFFEMVEEKVESEIVEKEL